MSERRQQPPAKTLPEVVAEGDRAASLRALRDRLAGEVARVDGRYLAPLAKQLADVLRELESLPAAGKVDPLDELASRRTSRRSSAAQAQ